MNKGTFFWSLLFGSLIVLAAAVSAEDVKPEIDEALNAGDTTQAIKLLNEQISVDKSYHYNFYVLGMIYFNQGQWKKAEEQFEIAVDKKSGHIESWYQLGLTRLRLDDIKGAEEAMEKGRKKADKDDKYIFDNGQGLVAMAKEEYTEASRLFQSATIADSTVAEYWINLGDAYFYQGVAPLAVNYYEKALALDTAGLEVYFHWSEACLEMRDYQCAMEKLRTVLQKDSTHAPAWMRAGEIYFKAALSSRQRSARIERFRETIGSYKQYLDLSDPEPDSSNVRAFFEIAMAYLNINAFPEAIENFEKVLSIPYEPRDIYFYYGRALWGARDYEKSGEMLQKHIEWVSQQDEDYTSGVDEAELYQLLGDDWYYRKTESDAVKNANYAKAIGFYKQSLAADSGQTRLLQNMAIGYHMLGSLEQALEYYDLRIAEGIDSGSAAIVKNAGYAAQAMAENAAGSSGGAMEEEFIEEDFAEPAEPADPTEYYALAVNYYEQYLQFEPDDQNVIQRLGIIHLYDLQNCAEGVKYMEKLLTLDPDNCEAKRSLGYAYFYGACDRNYGKALNYLSEANQCANANDPCKDATVKLWIAQAYHLRAAEKTGNKQDASSDFEQANAWYSNVLKCEPNNEEAKKGRDETQFEF